MKILFGLLSAGLLLSSPISVFAQQEAPVITPARIPAAATQADAMARFGYAIREQRPDVFLTLVGSKGMKVTAFIDDMNERYTETFSLNDVAAYLNGKYRIGQAMFTPEGSLRKLAWRAQGNKLVPQGRVPHAKHIFASFVKEGKAWVIQELSLADVFRSEAG